jgi:hypothetical protein
MHPVERAIRGFNAVFCVRVGFCNWVRTRGRQLERAGESFTIVLVWGRRRFRLETAPNGDPYLALERADGTLERSPYADE